jgi:predicted ester cyclase
MSVDKNLQLSLELLDAYNDHNLDLLPKFWSNEKEGLARREFQKNFWLKAFPDTYMEVVRWIAQNDQVVLEAIVSATHLGPLEFWVTEPIQATNKKIRFPICEIFTWKNGKLTDIQAYFDRGHILKQLGLEDKIDWEQFN